MNRGGFLFNQNEIGSVQHRIGEGQQQRQPQPTHMMAGVDFAVHVQAVGNSQGVRGDEAN